MKNKNIVINKKVLFGIAPALPIIGILLSKNRPGQLLLFLIGIIIGIIIGKNLIVKKELFLEHTEDNK